MNSYTSLIKSSGVGDKVFALLDRSPPQRLLKNPPICIQDEATSAQDTITEASVKEALDRLASDQTVLVIAHRLGTIKNADNIIVLRDVMIHEQGTHEELLALEGQ